jgi:hypothetical protein
MVKNKQSEIINRKATSPNSTMNWIKPAKILKEKFENFLLYVRLPQSVPPLIVYYTL